MPREPLRDLWSVIALVVGFLLAAALLLAAVGASLCGLFGEQCTAEEQRTIALLSFASLGVFLFVPAAVAAVRRQARWLLAPVVEVVLVVLAVRLNEWF